MSPDHAPDALRQRDLQVVVVEDDTPTREALRVLLDGTPGFECVAAFGSVEQALRGAVRHQPDVVLLDINLPGMSGIDGVEPLGRRFHQATVLMLTVFDDEDRIFRSLCRGAGGYVLKKTPPARLLEYIRECASGGAPMSSEIAHKVVELFRTMAPRTQLECRLSPQETRLLALLAEGHTYLSSATTLGITENTVRSHIRAVYDKLHVHSKSEAVSKALRAGLI